MNLLRTIRLDASDTFIFDRAAEPGEWAVSGAFVFWHRDPAQLAGKARAAFRGGFLGLESLGWSTLVQIVEATDDDREAAVELLARKLVDEFGAPDLATARAAAEEEVAFAASLAEQPKDTLVAVHRSHDGGDVREAFRTLRPRDRQSTPRAFSFFDVEGEDAEAAPADEVRLVNLAECARK